MSKRTSLDFIEIGQRLNNVLNQKKMSRTDLAKRTGVSKSTVSSWLNGDSLNLKAITLIAKNLDISINWLVLGVGVMKPPVNIDLSQKEKTLLFSSRAISPEFLTHLKKLISEFTMHQQDISQGIPHLCAMELLKSSEVGVVLVGLNGLILEANDAFLEISGINRVTMLENSTSVLEIIPNLYKAKVSRELNHTHTSQDPFDNYVIINQENKQKIPIVTKAAMVDFKNNQAIGVIVKKSN